MQPGICAFRLMVRFSEKFFRAVNGCLNYWPQSLSLEDGVMAWPTLRCSKAIDDDELRCFAVLVDFEGSDGGFLGQCTASLVV